MVVMGRDACTRKGQGARSTCRAPKIHSGTSQRPFYDVTETLLRAVRTGGQAWLAKASLMPVSIKGPTIVGPGEKIFKMKVLRRLENVSLGLVFANTVFHKRVILLIF